MRNRQTTFSAAAFAALAAILAAPQAHAFDGRFEDNAGGTATAPPAGQQEGAADPIAKLRGEFARLQKEGDDLLTAAAAANRPLTDEEAKTNDKRFEKMQQVKKLIDEKAKFAGIVLAAEPAAAAAAAVSASGPQSEPPGRQAFAQQHNQQLTTGLLPGQKPGESRERLFERHKAAVSHFLRTGQDMTGQFTITRTTDSGALVPTRIGTPVVIKRITNPFRAALASRGLRTLSSGSTANIRIPYLDDTANVADVIAENATGDNPKDPAVTGVTLGAKLYDSGTVWFSNSLRLATDFDLYDYVEPRLDERIEQKQTVEWTAATILGTVGKTTATTTGVTYTELLQWQHSMPVVRRNTGVFIISDGLQLALRGLTDGNGRLIYQESARDDAPDRLLGWPVFVSAELAAPAAGAVSGIAAAADGLHIREVTPTRVVRYVDQPDWPDQFGVRKFANGDFAFETSAVRLLKHAAA